MKGRNFPLILTKVSSTNHAQSFLHFITFLNTRKFFHAKKKLFSGGEYSLIYLRNYIKNTFWLQSNNPLRSSLKCNPRYAPDNIIVIIISADL